MLCHCLLFHREGPREKTVVFHTCIIRLLSFSIGVAGDDLADKLPGCGVNVCQQGAIVGSSIESIPIDLNQP